MAGVPGLLLLALAAFVPPVLMMVGVRYLERYKREPMGLLFGLMGYGATLGVVTAIAVTWLADRILPPDLRFLGFAPVLVATVFVAPPIEELSKGIGLMFGRAELDEAEDGLIHGAAIGLGFAATENFAYGYLNFRPFGLGAALATIALRIFSSTILHAGTTALLGFSYSLFRLKMAGRAVIAGLYVVAILEHSLYNGLVLDEARPELVHYIGFAVGVFLVLGNAITLSWLIRRLDREGMARAHRAAKPHRTKDARHLPHHPRREP